MYQNVTNIIYQAYTIVGTNATENQSQIGLHLKL